MKTKIEKLLLLALCSCFLLSNAEVRAQESGCNSWSNCNDCCEEECKQFWFDAEYLYWQINNSHRTVPMVFTATTPTDAVLPTLETPGAAVVLGGNSRSKDKWHSGGRFTLGYWFNEEQAYGTEVSYFFLAPRRRTQTVSSNGEPGSQFLALPFSNAEFDPAIAASEAIALPGSFAGDAVLKRHNDMQGAEWNLIANFRDPCDPCNPFAWRALVGFRWWNFNDRLSFTTSSPFVGDASDVFATADKFHTRNNFYSGQVGLEGVYTIDNFFVQVKGKVALGAMCEQHNINGALTTNEITPPTTTTFAGGLLALPTNIGHRSKTRFAVLPEVNVNLGYKVTDWLSLKVGYTFFYVSRVAFANNQMSSLLNPSQASTFTGTADPVLVGTAAPLSRDRNQNLWVQGANVGIEIQF